MIRKLFSSIAVNIRWFRLKVAGTTVGQALGGLGVPPAVLAAAKDLEKGPAGASRMGGMEAWMSSYNPDDVVDQFRAPVMNPVLAFHEAVRNPDGCSSDNPFKDMKPNVREASLYEGRVDASGRRPTDPKIREALRGGISSGYKIRNVEGHDGFKAALEESEATFKAQPERSRAAREAKRKLIEDGFLGTDSGTPFDTNQYTEYVPLTGGPFFRQLYIYDFLKQIAYAFEAQNHNPVARAIINILVFYAFGRRFEVRVKDEKKKRAWEEYDRSHKIVRNFCRFWAKEIEIYGDFFFNKDTFQSIDPSTVWDIITEPDNIDNEFYLYQSYPTQYQMFTGLRVPGAPGAEKQKGSAYIVRQIPMNRVIHLKKNCVSNEKRGRSSLFTILGWLKRIKDLYNAQVIREWLYSSFIWDVTVKGSAADVQSFANQFPNMPNPGSPYFHNEAVTLSPMAAMATSSGSGRSTVGADLMGFIAVAVQIPKEFLNVVSQGGGSRVQALTAAEPFTKMIEDIQSTGEEFLTDIFKSCMEDAGLEYEDGDVEFLFPSVTKDTTTETIKNIQVGESQGWLAKRTAAEMFAKEMNISSYDFEEEQGTIKDDQEEGFDLSGEPMAPAGRFGAPAAGDGPEDGKSEIHGDGKRDLIAGMKDL